MAQIRGEDLWSFKKVADILKKRTVTISHRSIWNLRHRYKNLLKTSPTSDPQQLLAIQKIGSSILDIFEVPSVGDWLAIMDIAGLVFRRSSCGNFYASRRTTTTV